MNSMAARRWACVLFVAAVVVLPAHANLTVHPMRLPVHDARGGQIRVYSQTPKVQYIQTRVQRLLHPATPDEKEVDVVAGQLDGLVVTPGKFVLGGGGNRLVRVIPLASVTEETAYRVYFEGVRAPGEEDQDSTGEGASASVGVSLVWGALVHVVPAQSLPDMRVADGQLHNTGNVRLGITEMKACPPQGECTTHSVERSVYPGASLALPFAIAAGTRLTVSYRLSQHGYRDHQRVLIL